MPTDWARVAQRLEVLAPNAGLIAIFSKKGHLNWDAETAMKRAYQIVTTS